MLFFLTRIEIKHFFCRYNNQMTMLDPIKVIRIFST